MFRVLIVDDDFTARASYRTMIDWHQSGFEICGEATNGQNAVQLLEQENPDIVIVDMNMPVMDGVALIGYLAEHYPDIKTIALSGYDDFAYVKESLKHGALDYLLKHKLDAEALLHVLQLAGDKISREHKLKKQISQSRDILRHDFIKRLVQGEIGNAAAIRENIRELGLPLEAGYLSVVVAALDDYRLMKQRFTREELHHLRASAADMVEEILRDMGNAVMSFVNEEKFVILFCFGSIRSELYIYNHVSTTVNRIQASLQRYLNVTACFSLGRLFNQIGDISKFYRSADELLNEKIIAGRNRIFREAAQPGGSPGFFNLDLQDEKQIMAAIKTGNMGQIQDYIEEIFHKIIVLKVNYKSIQMICGELIGIANRIARESSIAVKDIYNTKDIPYEEMKKCETIAEVKHWILGVYERLAALLLADESSARYTELTRKAIEFIRHNYAKDISLNQAAEHIGSNSSYLSRIFKDDCGMGFVEYVNHVRVQQAKYLMESTDIKLKEIVRLAGFNNYTYFFKVFKMIAGVTPLEYKGQCQKAL
ncbi:hypothetical protein P22_2869 [Propionispora sp. 2/2-37]|uniref:response regulator n=1 Tax=Propionispora sp. 2/2-37 TaxID=1677858 RepID=UPI0006BB66F0|nr:response regulator [Propionispora sp. 2/2-37]CUH96758.1 hypothetical protein P22_2869 [Propionispora sp. 2/2-37]